VDRGAERDAPERQRVARDDVRRRAGDDLGADLEAVRREDVALLAIRVVQEGDPRGAVRVVLDVRPPVDRMPTVRLFSGREAVIS